MWRLLAILPIGSVIALGGAPAHPLARQSDTPSTPVWWAFRSVVKARPPGFPAAGSRQPLAPIDAFLLRKLREKGLDFAPLADRRSLIRRATLDLHGLPPTPQEVEAFVRDLRPEAWERVVDRLLASPRYGERWARHWLDVVRFGETDGGEHNFERWNAWPYRDYVIDAFNRDLPYDEFIRDQIAGDALLPNDRSRTAATGFLVSGPWDQVSAVLNKDPVMKKTARMDELDDMVTTTSSTFLALTVNCARCHDHKFDPIPQRDYYRMTAAFSGAGFGERPAASKEEVANYEAQAAPLRSEVSGLSGRISAIEDPVTAKILRDKYVKFDRDRAGEPQRIPLNPIYNRTSFAPRTARYWRLVVLGQYRAPARIEALELRRAGHVVRDWAAKEPATPDKPVVLDMDLGSQKQVSEMVWSTDTRAGHNEGAIQLYRLEYSTDASAWSKAADSLGHISRLEQDLPQAANEEIESALSPEDRALRGDLIMQRNAAEAKLSAIAAPAKIYACTTNKPEKAFVLERGSVQKPKEQVSAGALSAITQLPSDLRVPESATDGERRVALANWVASPRNPLTARVIANRLWYFHFGAGIVNTPSDFGLNGDRPSNPELLDWMASSLVEHGWRLKWLHREIMLSRAYRQSSKLNPRAMKVDAGNRLVWRMPLRRMDAETLRDSLLSLSGSLDLRMGGPSFALHQKGARGSYIYRALQNDGPPVWRRAVYRFVVRGGDPTLLDSFDCPDPSVATPQRPVSNTPIQALALMNNAFVIRQAGLLAARLEREAAGPAERVRLAYRLALSREPSPAEISTAARFLAGHPLSQFCRALMNSNEFIHQP